MKNYPKHIEFNYFGSIILMKFLFYKEEMKKKYTLLNTL